MSKKANKVEKGSGCIANDDPPQPDQPPMDDPPPTSDPPAINPPPSK